MIIAYSGFANKFPQYIALVREICKRLADYGFKIIVKYHPREEVEDYCGLSFFENAMFLSKEISVEFVYLLRENKLKFVIGDISSALITAKWILKEKIRVYSVAPVLQVNDQRLFEVFKKINIEILNSVSEFKNERSERGE